MNRAAKWVGGGLAVAASVAVALKLYRMIASGEVPALDNSEWALVGLLCAVYAGNSIALAIAWKFALGWYGVFPSTKWVFRVFGMTQLGKYLPGNFGHLAGRQAFGMAAGYPAWPLARATLLAFIVIAGVASMFGLLVLPLVVDVIGVELSVVVFVTAASLAVLIVARCFGRLIVGAITCDIAFLVGSGAVFVALTALLSADGLSGQTSILTGAAFVVAWLAGFIVPGAPAGIGIREVVLLHLLDGGVGRADLLLSIGLMRLVTTVGDCIFFLGACLVRK